MLGGVHVRSARGLLGHSDGDVLCHAVADALLGAAGLGDLGQQFPAGHAATRGLAGLQILRRVAKKLGRRPKLLSLDAVVICETPRIAKHIPTMCRNIARALAVPHQCVNVKPKHPEGLGALGRAEGIAAQAVALMWYFHG